MGKVGFIVDFKLISFQDGIAVIECFPEGKSLDSFQLTLDVTNQKILKNTLNEKGNSYAVHAAWRVFDEYSVSKTISEKDTVIWQ